MWFPTVFNVNSPSRYISEFWGYNRDLPVASESGVQICFVELLDSINILLLVEDETTIDAIRNSWHLILKWRDRLKEYVGERHNRESLFYQKLHSMKYEEGLSYAEIAKEIDHRVVKLLKESVELEKEYKFAYNSNQVDSFSDEDLITWELKWGNQQLQAGRNVMALSDARRILEYLGLSEEDTNQWIDFGVENVRNGRRAFKPNKSPISKDKVRYLIRHKTRQNS